jgi:hypothetical protein
MAQTTTSIPDDLVKQLQEQIESNVPDAQGLNEIKQGFCDAWPTAQTALEGLRTVLNLVPGVSMFAGSAITLVLAAGGAANGALCKK